MIRWARRQWKPRRFQASGAPMRSESPSWIQLQSLAMGYRLAESRLGEPRDQLQGLELSLRASALVLEVIPNALRGSVVSRSSTSDPSGTTARRRNLSA